jgi:arylformamidase
MRQPPEIRSAIASLGCALGPDVLRRSQTLFAAKQRALGGDVNPVASDLEYSTHPRQRLDIYAPAESTRAAPILVWVHGGGFVRGDKRPADQPFNAHVGRWIARDGFVGVVMNYRLAPESGWPSGGEDVGLVVDWLKEKAHHYGGDPERIVLAGTSAGAVHIGTYLQMGPDTGVIRGAVLLSGLYGVTPLDDSDRLYFSTEEAVRAGRASLEAIAKTSVPLLLASAEFDPPRFQAETRALVQAVSEARGSLPRAHFASGHNHYTLAMHLGSSDTRLSDEILSFIREETKT